jgi:putative SOS response-associated peptidase YedK
LVPAVGFYEWRKTAKPKLPFAIAMKDGRPFTFAGLWENWKDPEIWGVAANLHGYHRRAQ